LTYILLLTVWVCLHSNFSGGLHKTIFSARVHFGRSRSLILVPIESAFATSC